MKETNMRYIKAEQIKKIVAGLCYEANVILRPDILGQLKLAFKKEHSSRAKKILKAIIDNAKTALHEKLAICQDTGMPVVFVQLGQDVHVSGGNLTKAINDGVGIGYKRNYLRNSIIKDPITRGKPGFSPAVIHYEIVPGQKIKITLLPKGFGCENKAQVKMFKPTTNIKVIKEFVVDAVKQAGPDACPPFVVGIGIGGTQDYACLLAKKALLRKIDKQSMFEKELLKEINKLGIGPMGLGGKVTCLGVNIETYPTHIAGLPMAVNISCHAMRSASAVL